MDPDTALRRQVSGGGALRPGSRCAGPWPPGKRSRLTGGRLEHTSAGLTTINPANHAKSEEAIATYEVEPYLRAADVYAVALHTGRGGWTWYTASAGWMYRLLLESLLGLRLEVDRLHVAPCLPVHWVGVKIHYRFRETVHHIAITQTRAGKGGVTRVRVDGSDQDDHAIVLVDDRREHAVQVTIAAPGYSEARA